MAVSRLFPAFVSAKEMQKKKSQKRKSTKKVFFPLGHLTISIYLSLMVARIVHGEAEHVTDEASRFPIPHHLKTNSPVRAKNFLSVPG